jgi:hypothetical protein
VSTLSDRDAAVGAIIRAYLDLPDTPNTASPNDYTVAACLIDNGWSGVHVLRAIKLAFIRRHVRDHAAGALPKIRSFVYIKRVLEGLRENELADDYALYIDYTFAAINPDHAHRVPAQSAQPAKNPPK